MIVVQHAQMKHLALHAKMATRKVTQSALNAQTMSISRVITVLLVAITALPVQVAQINARRAKLILS